jgi:peptide/histidine transporter 3/4
LSDGNGINVCVCARAFGMAWNAGVYAAAYIAGNAFSFSLTSYLIGRYNMKQNAATNVNNVFSGTFNFAPVVGAFVADAFWGRFRTLLFGTVVGVAVSFCFVIVSHVFSSATLIANRHQWKTSR